MKKIIYTLILLSLANLLFAKDKANVLIIGDSIAIGYTPFVAEELKEEANVAKISTNAKDTNFGAQNVKNQIPDKKWDIIHFNYGIWDLCYRHPKSKVQGKRDKINGTITTSLEDYETNLQKIVDILKTYNAKLIFATTTYVPAEEKGRFQGDEVKYNEVAIKVMQKNDIIIDPLYDISEEIHKTHGKGSPKDGDVHYQEEGYKALSKQVIKSLRENF